MQKKAGDHSGHRQRMIEKLKTGVLTEEEYLEILLFNAIPRRNTSDIAHRLIARFGRLANVLAASFDELKKIEGVGESVAAYITCVEQFYKHHYVLEKVGYDGPYDARRFANFIWQTYCLEEKESLTVYLLDGQGYVYHQETFAGIEDASWIQSTQFARLMADYAPGGIVLVHNHPTQKAQPSENDEKTTKRCQVFCAAHNVILVDHLIYAQDGVYSYYLSEKMKGLSRTLTLENCLTLSEKEEKEEKEEKSRGECV